MKKRRLVFYTSANCYASLEVNVMQALEWLKDDGYEILLITDTRMAVAQEAEQRGVECIHLPAPKFYLGFSTARSLARILKELQPSLFLVVRPRDILLCGLSKWLFNRKLSMVFFQRSFLRLKKHPLLYKVLFSPYNAWISPSEIIRASNLKLTGYPEANMSVIPTCIDTSIILNNVTTMAEARKQLHLPVKKFIIGTTGKYSPQNRLDFLIRSAQFLQRHNYSVEVVFLSTVHGEAEQEYLDFLKELVNECQLEGQVHFRNNSSNFEIFLKAVDVFAVLRETEPSDQRILKAMVTPAIVAANATPYHAHLVGNGKYGLLFQQDDLVDFSSKMIHLLTQPLLKDHLRDVSRQHAVANYDREKPCRVIEELFNQLD